MTHNEFIALCEECLEILKAHAPIKTGNLRYNACRLEIIGDTARIYIDEEIAPYAKYTIEPWSHKKNPNEGWFDKAVEAIVELIQTYRG